MRRVYGRAQRLANSKFGWKELDLRIVRAEQERPIEVSNWHRSAAERKQGPGRVHSMGPVLESAKGRGAT